MKIEWDCKSYSLYPLTLKGYPRKTHFLALGENLCLDWAMVEAKHKYPKTLRWEYEGGLWNKSSNGDLLFKRGEGILFIK